MKLNSLYVVAFGAALASIEAAPIRLLAATNPDLSIRFGHGIPPQALPPILDIPQVQGLEGRANSVGASSRPPCFMRKMTIEAIKISNSFRKAVGLPLIESPMVMKNHQLANKPGNTVSILPFIGTPPTYVDANGIKTWVKDGEIVRVIPPDGMVISNLDGGHPGHPGHPDHHPHPPHHPQHGHHGHHPHHGHKHHRPCRHVSFFKRLMYALMSLGTWEGRAVAFVLGCGLGVLLRMIWVLSVIAYRSYTENRREEVEYTVIHEYIDAGETPVPPPGYTAVDEKVDAEKKENTPAATVATA